MSSLKAHFRFEPCSLKFGTSGRRGLVAEMPQVEIYVNALAEIEYLQSLGPEEGGIVRGEEFYFASDLRPTSSRFMEEFGGNGELAQAIRQAIADAGMQPVFLGYLPTPALTNYALRRQKGSIMVTGSHIPFDRNGYKTNTSRGELLKQHELPIAACVARVRERVYGQEFEESLFDADGRFKAGSIELPAALDAAREEYIRRYTEFFAGDTLKGLRLVVYQHSAVGRDMLVEILNRLGAETIPAGRSESFVPIDTENIDDALLAELGVMVREAAAKHGPGNHSGNHRSIDALVSTDGDSDRPLVLGVREDGSVQFFSGDRLGMVVAQFLGADAVVVPISCNDAIDRSALSAKLEPKTRIGSPFVIAGMELALARDKRSVCGWEANGGFLTGSVLVRKGHELSPLPTRDALLPVLSVLFAAQEKQTSLTALFDALPERYGRAALLKNFSRVTALRIVAQFTPAVVGLSEMRVAEGAVKAFDAAQQPIALGVGESAAMVGLIAQLSAFFPESRGFRGIVSLNYTDGLRIAFSNGDVAHIRPSGNADELRIYATADHQARAEAIAGFGIEEPDGLLRTLERAVSQES